MYLSTIGVIVVAILMTAAEIWIFVEHRKKAKSDPEFDKRMQKAIWRNRLFPLLSFALLLSGSPASAQTWIEQRTDVKADQSTPRSMAGSAEASRVQSAPSHGFR